MVIDVDQIGRRALNLLAEVGLDGLTTRRLGDELGVQGPALYYHFRNKSELLGHVATVILRESLATITDHGDWQRWLLDHAIATRTTLLRYRDSARILAASVPTEAITLEIMPALAKPLINAGFLRIEANETVSLIAAFTLGFVINEQNDFIRTYVSSAIHVDREFLHGVEALITGSARSHGSRVKARRAPLRGRVKRRANGTPRSQR